MTDIAMSLNEELPKRWRRHGKRRQRRKRIRGTQSYPCPKCESDTRVTRTKRVDGGTTRERTCKKCHHKFVTVETAQDLEHSTSGKRVSTPKKPETRKRARARKKSKLKKRADVTQKTTTRKRASKKRKPK